jgi:putative aminopeptidase FrvX
MVACKQPNHYADQSQRNTASKQNRPELWIDVGAETEENTTILGKD